MSKPTPHTCTPPGFWCMVCGKNSPQIKTIGMSPVAYANPTPQTFEEALSHYFDGEAKMRSLLRESRAAIGDAHQRELAEARAEGSDVAACIVEEARDQARRETWLRALALLRQTPMREGSMLALAEEFERRARESK